MVLMKRTSYYWNVLVLLVLLIKQGISDDLTEAPPPIVMWHGMGDTCCFPFSLGTVTKMLKSKLGESLYVKSLKIGESIITDYESGFFVHPNKQVEEVCRQLSNDPKLGNGYNAIGFSQGGQFLRAVAQRCPVPPMLNLITLGGQHQGVFGLPNCPSLSQKSCESFRRMLNVAAYTNWMQNFLVQATYWHDPLNEQKYVQSSSFLADINNERSINQTYIENLMKLKRFVMVKFTKDTIVQPLQSQWFEFYEPNQDKVILPLNESSIYIEDKLGLKAMMDANKLIFLESEGNHLQFTDEWFTENIIPILQP
ncbi:Palmitoyl-protein thioesterase 1 [Pseudolycoriella hygida]|uniref:Palmitoyl-protein thioesterase 1 n=1 Tax=Pseudolycoriella hygida TaxID=35572 RepID=A0A9Q0RYZ3_9DIPT|nr:Palmitoyl-protein thioesterase 1 [Pseudolycoriella hygida]